ncbi:tetrahydrocannabinolic acid synthase-like protein [Carex littledalei]|uniref:Tetrahydrocannabinolic acid synthase-like protein n=1 Tax=Carex littledalei TaxID=544730 RepID=A0A833R127_9POAL|nr:tetrahydrocannabinolic acid synthase-like protein [Carex littledalei]
MVERGATEKMTLLWLLLISISPALSINTYDTFLNCLSFYSPNSNISQILYNQTSISYEALLNSTIQNLRFTSPTITKPILILIPTDEHQIQASVSCCKNQSLSMRVRSGGHDYEGLSYRSVNQSMFVMLDLTKLRSIHVHSNQGTAWVQSGATVGELYYKISKKNSTLAFPAATCSTVAVGGQFSGGGIGTLMRKYGLSADNILDAKIIDSNGRILDRAAMGEDLFWAIRGGGGGSFGIVSSWKVRLVQVPQIVSIFTINRTLDQGAIDLIYKWQYIAFQMDPNMFLEADIRPNINGTEPGAVFNSLYLGRCTEMLNYMQVHFPDLGVGKTDCREMSWIQSAVYFARFGDANPKILLDRGLQPKIYNKGTSDYVTDPIPLSAWQGIFDWFRYKGAGSMYMISHGGVMSEILESEIPYPHRERVLYNIQYLVTWRSGDTDTYLEWIREFRSNMTCLVSKNPRRAYVNFRDLELGRNDVGQNANYENVRVFGEMYFTDNFRSDDLAVPMMVGRRQKGHSISDITTMPIPSTVRPAVVGKSPTRMRE